MSPGELKLDHKEIIWTCVFQSSNVSLLPLAKSLLESADIDYFVQGEEASSLLPLGPFGVGIHNMNARINVPTDQAQEANEVLAMLKEGMED